MGNGEREPYGTDALLINEASGDTEKTGKKLSTREKMEQEFEHLRAQLDAKMEQKCPRWAKKYFNLLVYNNGGPLTPPQFMFWAVILGLVMGVFSSMYIYLLRGILFVSYDYFYVFLKRYTDIFVIFPDLYFIPMVIIPYTFLLGCSRFAFPTIKNLKDFIVLMKTTGVYKFGYFPKMFVVTLFSIVCGSSVGPEAVVILTAGSVTSYLFPYLTVDPHSRSILTLSAAGAALSAFFGLPVGGGLFVLEVVHHGSWQDYLAVPFVVMSSVVSVAFSQLVILDEVSIGGRFVFPHRTVGGPYQLLIGIGLGVCAGIYAAVFLTARFWMMECRKKILIRISHRLFFFCSAIFSGVIFSICGMCDPVLLFWSENQIQALVTQGIAPYFHFSGFCGHNYVVIAVLKPILILVSLFCGLEGGIIFPLIFASIAASNAIFPFFLSPENATFCAIAFSAAVNAAVTRTPISSAVVMVTVHLRDSMSTGSVLPGVLIACIIACEIASLFPDLFPVQRLPKLLPQ